MPSTNSWKRLRLTRDTSRFSVFGKHCCSSAASARVGGPWARLLHCSVGRGFRSCPHRGGHGGASWPGSHQAALRREVGVGARGSLAGALSAEMAAAAPGTRQRPRGGQCGGQCGADEGQPQKSRSLAAGGRAPPTARPTVTSRRPTDLVTLWPRTRTPQRVSFQSGPHAGCVLGSGSRALGAPRSRSEAGPGQGAPPGLAGARGRRRPTQWARRGQ